MGMKSKQLKLVITYEQELDGNAVLLMSLKIVQNEQNKWSIIEKGLRCGGWLGSVDATTQHHICGCDAAKLMEIAC